MARKINAAGLELLEAAEGYSSKPYKDAAGYWTYGIGHKDKLLHPDSFITHTDAMTLLAHDLEIAATTIEKYVLVPLTDNQFSALVSFAFNVGCEAFKNSTLMKELNRCHYAAAADQLLVWDHVNGHEVAGLAVRREAERTLFLKTGK